MTDNSIGKRNAHVEIKLLLNYSHCPYQKYFESNKKFIYASDIMTANATLYEQFHYSIVHLKDDPPPEA